MSDEAGKLKAAIEAAIEEAVDRGINPILWDLHALAQTFHEAADRLIEEQRRLDMMKSEVAKARTTRRIARGKAYGSGLDGEWSKCKGKGDG